MVDTVAEQLTIPAPEAPGDIELRNRMRTLNDNFGFMPTSRGETNESYSLMSFIDEPGGAAKHLNEILRHQRDEKTKTDDPTAAVRSVANEYVGYARRARGDRRDLMQLKENLEDGSFTNQLQTLRGMHLDDGVRQMVRFLDLTKFVEGDPLPLHPLLMRGDGRRSALDPYTIAEPSREMVAHIKHVAGATRAWQARLLIDRMIQEQANRQAFWTDRLVEARSHLVARPIASKALESLGVKLERVS